jgi:hypothetical protein
LQQGWIVKNRDDGDRHGWKVCPAHIFVSAKCVPNMHFNHGGRRCPTAALVHLTQHWCIRQSAKTISRRFYQGRAW